jgi:DNA-directed RNA polymerase sigma subunit (sigma70/sigma32)
MTNRERLTAAITDALRATYGRKPTSEWATAIDRALRTLAPQESKVLRALYGVATGEPKSRSEVAQWAGLHGAVTRERVRQIHDKAFRKLLHPSRFRMYRDCLPTEALFWKEHLYDD